MNKKLIALAVAGATVAPAVMAQTANPVTLYGRAYVLFESTKASGGATAPQASRNRVTDQSSLFGIRGTEDLGDGLKAFFQLETVFRLDQSAAVGNTTASTFANRNSGVGVQGDFGSVLLGRWDTPWKVVTTAIDPFGDLTPGGLSGNVQDRSNFDRRENNTVQWWSPNWSGFQFRAGYAANEGKTATVNPSGISLTGTYTQGPVYVGYAWERHKDQYGAYNRTAAAAAATTGADETGQAIFGNFTFGPMRVGLMSQRFKKNAGPTVLAAAQPSDLKSNMLALTYTAGKSQFIWSYMRSKDGAAKNATVQPDCKTNVLGYFYNFSRRTSFLAQWTQINNGVAGQCDFGADRLGSTTGGAFVSADQDPRSFAVGLRHTF